MSVIEEAAVEQTLDEKEVDPLEENDNTDLKQAQGSEQPPEEEEPPAEEDPIELGEIVAERFDFTMMETFYAHCIKIDEYGERLTCKTSNLGRIMTKEGLHLDDEETPEGEELPEEGAQTPIIPVNEMTKVFYFQWRIDHLE